MLTYSSFLETNREFIQEVNLGLNDFPFETVSLSDNLCIYQAKTSKLSIKYKDILLHSLYDPEREARRFAISQEVKPGQNLLVYGLGLGYHVKYLADLVGPEGRVIIFEPNREIVEAALILADFREIFRAKNTRVITGVDEDELAFKLSGYISKDFSSREIAEQKIIIHLPSFKCFPDVSDRIKEVFDLLLIEKKASEIFGGLQQQNFVRNLDVFLRSPKLESLRTKTAGKPVFFVNAGPSLDRSFRFLKENHERAFVFASDSAFPFLLQMDIPVDIVFSVDPQEDTKRHLAVKQQSRALLVALPTVDADALEEYPGPKMCVYQKGNSITKQFEEVFDDYSSTEAGGSVSCIGLDLILKLQCDPIIFLGTDYAFPQNKFYFSHAVETKCWFDRVSRFNTPEMMHYDVIEGESLMYVEDRFGKKIPANKTLYLYLKQIEGMIDKYPEGRFYNFLSQGAKIKGTNDITSSHEMKQILAEPIQGKSLKVDFLSVNQEKKKHLLGALNK